MTNLTEASTSKFIRIEDEGLDVNIHYNDAGAGETVVMLHGSGPGASGWSNFHRNIGSVVDAGYRVILMDCPGWNKSDPIVCRESRPHQIARLLRAMMDRLDIPFVHLVGNSMGAVAANDFAHSYPDRVGKMALLGGGGVGPSLFNPMPMEGIKLIQRLYADPTMDNLMKMLEVFVYDPKALPEELIKGRYENIVTRPEHLANWIESWKVHPAQFPDFSQKLAEIEAPSLIIWGRDDRFVPIDNGLRMLWGLRNSELHIFGQCGHWAQWEHADKFNRLLLTFLAG